MARGRVAPADVQAQHSPVHLVTDPVDEAHSHSHSANAVAPAAVAVQNVDEVAVDLAAAGPRINPWHNRTPPWTVYEVLKTVIGVLLLVPLRLTAVLLLGCTWALLARLFVIGVSRKDLLEKPLCARRRRLFLSLRVFPRLIFAACGFVLIEERVDDEGVVVARGSESFPPPDKVPPFVVGTHPSIFEPLYVFFRCMPSVVAKAETLHYPLLWSVLAGCQSLFVNRGDKRDRKRVMDALASRSESSGFPPTLIFPEGTTCNGTCVVQFKPGAFIAGAPVLPIIFRFPFRHYDPSWTTQSLPGLLIRTLCQFRVVMRVTVMEPHVPTDEEKKNAALFASNVRDRMARVMGVPVTRHSYEDVFLINEARRARVEQDFAVADFKAMFGIDEAAVRTLVRRFRLIDTNHDGRIGYYELRKLLDVNPKNALAVQHLDAVFEILDTDERGEIDFYSFVTALSLSGLADVVAGAPPPAEFSADALVPMSKGVAKGTIAALGEERARKLREESAALYVTAGHVDPLAMPLESLGVWASTR